MLIIFIHRYGSQPPIIYTESLNVNQLMLVITSLSESLAGYFYCSASYANSEYLEEKVKIETFGENNELLNAFLFFSRDYNNLLSFI